MRNRPPTDGLLDRDVEVLGPAPYSVPRVNNEWRYRIAFKTENLTAARLHPRDAAAGGSL